MESRKISLTGVQQLYEFIKEKNPEIQEVLDVRVKDDDDEDGFIGEHYIVNCLVRKINPNTPSGFPEENVEKTCLVDIKIFRKWVKNEESIKWI